MTSFVYCADLGGGSGCASCGTGGGLCLVTDPMGNVTRQELDIVGRVTKVSDPLGNETGFTYDALGRKIAQTDPEGHTTRYEYDTAGRLTAVVEANGARTEYTYDLAGNKLTQKDANGHVWRYTYTAMNLLETETDPLNHVTTYRYNTAGQLTGKQTPNGQTIAYSYTHRRLTGITHDGVTEAFAYDTLGRKTGMSNAEANVAYAYDSLNRLTTLTDLVAGRTITCAYDANGQRIRMDIAAGGVTEATVKYFYDSLGRLARQEDSRTGVYEFGYDALSRRTSLSYPNGVKAVYQYDAASRLTALVNLAPDGSAIDGYSYTYNKAGMRTTMTTLGSALGSNAGTHSYAYDPTYKLLEANYPNGRFEHFTYDDVGNRLTLADDKGSTSYGYNEMNELLTETRTDNGQSAVVTQYQFDPSGNTISKQKAGSAATTYQWDALNRLVALSEDNGTTHSFAYDPNGIRCRMTRGATTTRFLLAGEDIVEDLTGGAGAWAVQTYYSHGPGIDEPLAQLKASATTPGYLHHDALGSVSAMTNNNGLVQGTNVYNAYGTVANDLLPGSLTKVDSRYGYTSRELDQSGLMYYRARYLTPGTNFLSRDPNRGEKYAPETLNRYILCGNNPTNFLDPTGKSILSAIIETLLVIVLVVGAYYLFGFTLLAAIVIILIVVGFALYHLISCLSKWSKLMDILMDYGLVENTDPEWVDIYNYLTPEQKLAKVRKTEEWKEMFEACGDAVAHWLLTMGHVSVG